MSLRLLFEQIPDLTIQEACPFIERGKLRVFVLVKEAKNIVIGDLEHLGELALGDALFLQDLF